MELRTKENLNREYLAVRMGVSSAAIQTVETIAKHNPSIALILKYLKYFDVKLEELVEMDIELGDAV